MRAPRRAAPYRHEEARAFHPARPPHARSRASGRFYNGAGCEWGTRPGLAELRSASPASPSKRATAQSSLRHRAHAHARCRGTPPPASSRSRDARPSTASTTTGNSSRYCEASSGVPQPLQLQPGAWQPQPPATKHTPEQRCQELQLDRPSCLAQLRARAGRARPARRGPRSPGSSTSPDPRGARVGRAASARPGPAARLASLPHARRPRAPDQPPVARPSISTTARSSTRPETSTRVVAGKWPSRASL